MGGPIGGVASKVLSEVLGCAPEPKAIDKALRDAGPDELARIREAELKFETKMKEMDVDIFELETKDKQDARTHFASDWTARIIGVVMVGFFCSYIAMITIMPPEQNSMELINLVLGYMGGLVSAIISFYFGASAPASKGDE
jgi:uncharacterized membrane protein YeaQ/YmgE (transglycosylase-associated protein family)